MNNVKEYKKPNKYENFNKDKKKAYAVTWDNSDESSSISDLDSKLANICFMTYSDEVQTDMSYNELFEISTELHKNHRLVKDAKKVLMWKLDRAELEINMFKDEKVNLEEELEKEKFPVNN